MKRSLLASFLSVLICAGYCRAESLPGKPTDTLTFEFYGVIASVDSNILKICRKFGELIPETGTSGTLSESFELKMYDEITSGWIETGQGIVTNVSQDTIAIDIQQILKEFVADSQHTEPFTPFTKVKFTWAGAIPKDDLAYKTGMSYFRLDNEKALEYFQRTLRINPEYHRALNMIGIIKELNNDFDGAISYFKLALEIDNGNITYLKNIAMAWFSQGKYHECRDYACQAIKIDSTDAEAHFLKGMTSYYLMKVSDEADVRENIMYELDLALALDSNNHYYYSQRAYIRNEFGNRDGACEDAQKVELLGGKDAEMLMNAYCKNHKKEKQ